MKLEYFSTDSSFPFFIQFGHHEDYMYVHSHQDFSELVVVLEGSATHMVDDEELMIKKGDVFVINNGTRHGYKNLIDFKICNIMFDFDYMFSDHPDLKTSAAFHTLFVVEPNFKERKFSSRTKLNDEELKKFTVRLKHMSDEYALRKTGYRSYLQSEFVELSIELIRKFERFECIGDSNISGIACVAAEIEKHFDRDYTVEDLAKMAGISVRHFTRVFSQTYNMPVTRYLETVRMNNAKLLLRSSSKSVTEIAYECGFSDNNYFARRFKALYQITPTAYRGM